MKKELLTYKDPKSPVSEVFRTLRTNIQFMNTSKKLKTILVTSTFPEEGKSWVTSNLAVTFAQAGKKVILIDADMRKGRQYNIFGVLPRPGLSNYLSNMDADNMETTDVKIASYLQDTGVENLHILVAGNVPPNPSELLVSRKMKELMSELKEMCDLVIIDGTPCDLVTDAIILSRFVDSTIIVTAQKETKKDSLQRIVKNIQNVGGKIAGVVVNKVDISSRKYNQSYYYGSISGGNTNSKRSKNKKRADDILANLFKYSQNDGENLDLDEEEPTLENNEELEEKIDIDEIKQISAKMLEENAENKVKPTQEQQQDTQTIETQQFIEPVQEINEQNDEVMNNVEETKESSAPVQEQTIDNYVEEADNRTFEKKYKEYTNPSNLVERAESAKDMSEDKANEIINLVNNYIKNEMNKQERKN